MKTVCSFFILIIGLVLSPVIQAQNLLPVFSVKELAKGKIQISWNNPYHNCIQLAIQRSSDSSKNFRTIFSSQSPELVSNGFVDNKSYLGEKNYYRIFYVLQGGDYFFTKAVAAEIKSVVPIENPVPLKESGPKKEIPPAAIPKAKDLTAIYLKKTILFSLSKEEYKHFKDSINKTKDALHRINEQAVEWRPAKIVLTAKKQLINIYKKDKLVAELDKKGYEKFKDSISFRTKDTLFAIDEWRKQLHSYAPPSKLYIFIYRNDSLVAELEMLPYKKFKDSIATKTKDTLFAIDNSHVIIHSFVPKYVWKPSQYIFTNTKGYVTILLPLIKQYKYHVIFYEEDGSELFRIKTIKDPQLVLDKTDFIHAGWFSFELFEDDKLKEKNKFLLTKD